MKLRLRCCLAPVWAQVLVKFRLHYCQVPALVMAQELPHLHYYPALARESVQVQDLSHHYYQALVQVPDLSLRRCYLVQAPEDPSHLVLVQVRDIPSLQSPPAPEAKLLYIRRLILCSPWLHYKNPH